MKKKKEFTIILPKFFGEKPIDKTIADKADKVINRKFTKYSKDIFENPQKYYYKFSFKINKVNEDDTATTQLVGHEISTDVLSKSVRKFTTRIDTRVKGITEDNVEIIIKAIIITAKNVKINIAKKIRAETIKFLKLYITKNQLDKIMKDLISDDLQRDIKKSLNSIYPIGIVEIRKTEINYK
ncbi:MAG: hypothetical protein B6U88_00205 [Candidatus Aenigmarchaeota archaeon ex4484_56]|nr:MAG: hypothetical protein B6U88_00205 [Candidatus Aenigmarchaeota archaeon ex4484_56]